MASFVEVLLQDIEIIADFPFPITRIDFGCLDDRLPGEERRPKRITLPPYRLGGGHGRLPNLLDWVIKRRDRLLCESCRFHRIWIGFGGPVETRESDQ